MKSRNRILAGLLVLIMVCTWIIPAESFAAEKKNGYSALEDAAAELREYMVERHGGRKVIRFYLEDERQLMQGQVWQTLLNAASVHTGVGTEGDALTWACSQVGYDMREEFDGTTHYITFVIDEMICYTTREQEQELNQKVEQILQELDLDGKSDYEKTFAIYDYVCKNAVYSEKALTGELEAGTREYYNSFSAYGILVNGEGVCQGFCNAMYRLLLEAGVENRIVAGDDHGWNIVKLGDQYYCLDATWDEANEPPYKWFLQGASEFYDRGHTPFPYYTSKTYMEQYPVSSVNYDAAATATGSGQCGDDAHWMLSEDGTLTISGSGGLWDGFVKSRDDSGLWDGLNNYIKKVVIESGITAIGKEAFGDCQAMTEISIPDTVTAVGDGAFDMCTALKEISLPDSVISLGESAFTNCWSLETVKLSNSISELRYRTFFNCNRMKAIQIPESVTAIGDQVFAYCTGLTGFIIPANVTTIGSDIFNYAFDASAKVSVTIPSTVTQIGYGTFAWAAVNEVIWEAGCDTIGNSTFYLCEYLENVRISGAAKTVGEEVFHQCNALKSVEITAEIAEFSKRTFEFNIGLKSVKLPDNLTTIPEQMFMECRSLEEFVVPASVTQIGALAFSGSGLKTVTFEGDAPKIVALADDGNEATGLGGEELVVFYAGDNATWTQETQDSIAPGAIWLVIGSELPGPVTEPTEPAPIPEETDDVDMTIVWILVGAGGTALTAAAILVILLRKRRKKA